MSDLERALRSELERRLSPHRVAHSLGVVHLASRLSSRFGVDEEAAIIAGLGHDLAKADPLSAQRLAAGEAAARWPRIGIVVTAMESEPRFGDKILHGPAASFLLFDKFGVRDADILEAVAFHSSASPAMSPLASVLYIADKLEPGRGEECSALLEAALARPDARLDSLLATALGRSIAWLRSEGHAIAQSTLDLYNALTEVGPRG